jgi:lipoprotein NlpI/transglutaminase-like putative cysteine protease
MLKTSWRAAFGRALVCITLLASSSHGLRAQGAAPAQAPFKEVSITAGKFSLGDPAPAWVDAVEFPQPVAAQPTSVRLAETQYNAGAMPTVYVRRVLTVNDGSALASVGQIPIAFVPDYQSLKLHSIRILRGEEALDRTVSSSLRFLQREMGLEQGVYSGEVTASILVNDLRVGDTLDYAYSIQGQNPVFGDKFVAGTGWDSPFATALRRVVLNYPTRRPVHWRVLRQDQAAALTPRETSDGVTTKLVFEERALAGVPFEPFAPADEPVFRSLQFSEFASWEEVVQWADSLFQVDKTSDGEVRKVAETLRGLASDEERVVAALEFVQSQIRYFSLSLGESSHRPAQPDAVLLRRYGDCKDKSVLLIALLKELGIESRPALLNIGAGQWLAKVLPTPQAFNHVIVQVKMGGQDYYLDPTRLEQHGRLRRMGQDHHGTYALLVAPGVHAPLAINSPNAAELAKSEVSETATLDKLGGPARLRVRQVWNGVGAEAMRTMRSATAPDYFARSVSQLMEQRYPGSKLAGDPVVEDDRVENVFVLTTAFDVPNLAQEKDGSWIVRFIPTNMRGMLPSPPSLTRRTPLSLPAYPFEAKYNFEVHFPENVSALRDPAAASVEDKSFAYSVASSFRGNVAKFALELRMLANRVPVADLPEYLRKKTALAETTSGLLIVDRSDIKSGGPAPEGFAERLRARIQEAADKTSETIKSGKVTGRDLAFAHCSHAFNLSYLGKYDEALDSINAGLKLDANSADCLTFRGYLHLTMGEFSKSVADYSKSISLGSNEADNYSSRGISKLYLGHLEEAADDFAKAGELGDREKRLYTDLWLGWALRRLGRPLPEHVVKRATAETGGDWPRPALALLTGTLTPDALVANLEAKTGDEKHMALAEGYFYLGQYYLGLGDKAKAREFFEKTRELGVMVYVEHVAAGFELQRLEALR